MASNSTPIGRRTVAVMFLIILSGSALLMYLMHAPSAELVRNLDSNDSQIVANNLTVLKERHDGAGLKKATALLNSKNSDIAINAALYLGAMGKAESVPYLIDTMKNVDQDTQEEIAGDLTSLTGKPFGGNATAWQTWWASQSAQKPPSVPKISASTAP